MCLAGETTYSDLAKHLLGWRLRVTEVACHAMDASHCTYTFDKDHGPWDKGGVAQEAWLLGVRQ